MNRNLDRMFAYDILYALCFSFVTLEYFSLTQKRRHYWLIECCSFEHKLGIEQWRFCSISQLLIHNCCQVFSIMLVNLPILMKGNLIFKVQNDNQFNFHTIIIYMLTDYHSTCLRWHAWKLLSSFSILLIYMCKWKSEKSYLIWKLLQI